LKPGWPALALVALLYFAGAKLAMLTSMHEGKAILWLPNAVVLAAALRLGPRALPAMGAVVLAIELLLKPPASSVLEALLFGLINFGEAALAFLLLRRLAFDPRFPTLADAWKFVLAGPFVAALAAAILGTAVYGASRHPDAAFHELARAWWLADGTGLLLFTPLLLAFPPFGFAPAAAPPWRPARTDAIFLAAVLVTVSVFLLAAQLGAQLRAFVFLPLSLVAAARYPQRWAPVAAAAVAALVMLAIASGLDPFGPLPPREAAVTARAFLFIVTLTTLGFAVLLGELRRHEAQLLARVAERTRELQDANERLERLASLDALTGVGNRRLFDEALALETERARRYGVPLSLVLVDLDDFKRINDTRGHAAGDEVLREVARALRERVRGADVVARFGGEEFAIILPHTGLEQARRFAERLRRTLAAQVHPVLEGRVTASFGVAQSVAGLLEGPALLAAADEALYEAKARGRNRVVAAAMPGSPVPEARAPGRNSVVAPSGVVKASGSGVDSP